MSSIALTAIVAKQKDAERIVEAYKDYFDKVFIQVNGEKPTKKDHDNVHYSYFEWCDDFAKARNALLELVDTDYWSWIDSDDTIDSPEKFKELLPNCDAQKIDALYMAYDYQRNEAGELDAYQWRERLLRTSHPWRWVGAIHETPISGGTPNCAKNEDIVIQHKPKTDEEVAAANKRNHTILLREYKNGNDPRIMFYLAGSYMFRNEDDKAVKLYKDYIKASGWDEEKHRAWCNISLIHVRNANYAEAIDAALQSLKLQPDYPEAYLTISHCYYLMEDYEKCLEWLKVGLSKPEPKTLSITSPSKRIIAMITGSFAELALGHPLEAKDLMDMAYKASPQNPHVLQSYPVVQATYDEQVFIDNIKDAIEYYAKHDGDIVKLFQSLPAQVRNDIRLIPERTQYLPKKVWADKSIVFYCGQAAEVWGPDTLEKGMGGSEEAIVYLAREFAKKGYEVVVYNDRDEEYIDVVEHATDFEDGEFKEVETKVTYIPWTQFNGNDEFSYFVSWRAPEFARGITAKHKFVDLHDTIQPERIYGTANDVEKFFVKSQYHRSLYPGLPDKKFAVISNGIVREQFNG